MASDSESGSSGSSSSEAGGTVGRGRAWVGLLSWKAMARSYPMEWSELDQGLMDAGFDWYTVFDATLVSQFPVMWIMSAVSNHLASLRFGKCEFSAETHLHAYMSWLLMKCGMVWPQPDDAVCIEKFTSLAHCWQTVERLSLEELMFPQRWEHKIDGPVTIAAILDVLFRDAQSGQSSIVHSISDADCDMNEDETPWIDFPSVDHNGSDACIDAGFCTVIFDGDALAPVKLNPAVGTTLQELLLAHEKLVGTASIQQCVDASGQSLPLSHCLTVGELIYVKFDTNAVIPQAILTADETKATCLDTPVSPTAAWTHPPVASGWKPSIYDIGECSVALLKDQPEWLNAEPLTGLQGDQFLLLSTPQISTPQQLWSVRNQFLKVQDRLAILEKQGPISSDDELRYHLFALSQKFVDLQVHFSHDTVKQLVTIDPLIATAWVQGKAFSCELWGQEHGFVHTQSLPVATVFKIGSHWVPVSMHPVGNALHVFVWDADGSNHLKLNEVIECLGLAMGFVSVFIQRDKRTFISSDLCGTLAIAYLHNLLLHVQLPSNQEETMHRFHVYRGEFLKSLSTCDITRRPWAWAKGDTTQPGAASSLSDTVQLPITLSRDQWTERNQDVRLQGKQLTGNVGFGLQGSLLKELAAVLTQHGVPVHLSEDRANDAIRVIGSECPVPAYCCMFLALSFVGCVPSEACAQVPMYPPDASLAVCMFESVALAVRVCDLPEAVTCYGWDLMPSTMFEWWSHFAALPMPMPPPRLAIAGCLNLFTDGSCFRQSQQHLRFAAWAVIIASPVLDSLQGTHVLESGPLPGLLQSAVRAELFAVVRALEFAITCKVDVTVWSDCNAVVRRMRRVLQGSQIKPSSAHADLWTRIACLVSNCTNTVKIEKVAAHRKIASASNAHEAWIFRHNQIADREAVKANLRRSPAFWELVSRHDAAVAYVEDVNHFNRKVLLLISQAVVRDTQVDEQCFEAVPVSGVTMPLPIWTGLRPLTLPAQAIRWYGEDVVRIVVSWFWDVLFTSTEPIRWVSHIQLYADFMAATGNPGPVKLNGWRDGATVPHLTLKGFSYRQRVRWFTKILKECLRHMGQEIKFAVGLPCSNMVCMHTGVFAVPWPECRLLAVDRWLYKLGDPLPAKHLEEQTGTKTYDLWCRKGGGTGWQDIKATDLRCRKGGGTGWQDIKVTDLWCRKGGGTGRQDIQAIDLWCRKGGGTGWQDSKATDLRCRKGPLTGWQDIKATD
ncbi:unnamed protein product [Cladocopium goreaui]|uniref:Reverse transcriptase domain-containing protein n=1 Tax=Cladocopium goreaui TaxID=2562237 RepID=A0A9P1BVM0_9DINO|nr:unnamed protein product [Cladocopium goreaui]